MSSIGSTNFNAINVNNIYSKQNNKPANTDTTPPASSLVIHKDLLLPTSFGSVSAMLNSASRSVYDFLSDFSSISTTKTNNNYQSSASSTMGSISNGISNTLYNLFLPVTLASSAIGSFTSNLMKPSPTNAVKAPSSINEGNIKIPSVSTKVNGVNIYIEPKGLQQIMRCESYVPPPGVNIKDGAGITVGYGHTGGGVKIRNKQDAVNVLAKDIKASIDDKFRCIPKDVLLSLNQDQLNALASAAMNMSSKGFRNFGPVKALLQQHKSIDQRIEDAGTEFMSKLRKGFSGLVWRRATEALTFSGHYVQNPGKDSVKLAKQNNFIV